MSLLHPTSPLPALPLLRPPKSLLSDRVGTGGDMLGQLLPAQVGFGGLFRGVRSTLAAGKAPATFPDPHHTRLLLPHRWATSDYGVGGLPPAPLLHPTQEDIWLVGGMGPEAEPHTQTPPPPSPSPKSPRNKIPKIPSCSGGPSAAPARPAHGWQWGSGLPGAWGWTCLKYFPCCISTRGTLPPSLCREGRRPGPPALPVSWRGPLIPSWQESRKTRFY